MAIVPANNEQALLEEVNGLLDEQNLSVSFRSKLFPEPVTSLPAKGYPGEQIIFKAATGVYWHLVYTGEETYPWAKIGGPSLSSVYTATESLETTSETPSSTNAPNVTLPKLSMEASVNWGANTSYYKKAGAQCRMKLFSGGAEIGGSGNNWTASGFPVAEIVGVLKGYRVLTFSSENKVEARYYRFGAEGTVAFYTPYLEIDPIRVG